jgi:multidrug efflux pump subunit AcrA (membrane-fusion protein)
MTVSRTIGRPTTAFTVVAAVAVASAVNAETASLRMVTVESIASDGPMTFDGRIEAIDHAEIANRIDGIVTAIHFTPGQSVEEEDLLFELAPEAHESNSHQRRTRLRCLPLGPGSTGRVPSWERRSS